MVYDDFVIKILPGQSNVHLVLAESDGAEAEAMFVVPAELATSSWEPLVRAGRDLLSPYGTRPFPSLSAREVGERLFRALFTDEVLRLFDQSMSKSGKESCRGLRLRLKIDSGLGLVLGLPWELLCLPSTRDFLGLSRRTPIARTLSVPRFVEPQLPAARLRILVIASSLSHFSDLDLETERRQLEAIVGWRKNLDMVFLQRATREELSQALSQALDQREPFHVLHFMGHGSFLTCTGEGALLFASEDNKPEEVTGQSLADELKDFPSLRLVVLNACHTGRATDRSGLDPFAGVAASLLLGGIPAVVAMRSRISDKAAITLSKTLYRRLVEGDPIDVAMADCRRAIRRKEEAEGEWALPLVFLRGQIHPLFQVQPDPRLRVIARGAAGMVLLALIVVLLLFKLRTQALANRVSPAGATEALKLNNAGIALLDQRKAHQARYAFLKALQANPRFAPAHANLAELDAGEGNYSEALDHARAAVQTAPKVATYEYNLGTILSQMGRNEEALEHLGRATDLGTCMAKASNERGNIFLNLGLPTDAQQEIEQGIRCDPSFAPLYKNLARVDLAHGRNAYAIQNLKKALPLYDSQDARGSAEVMYWLSIANSRAGNRDAACEALKQLQGQGTAAILWEHEARGIAQQEGCGGVFQEK